MVSYKTRRMDSRGIQFTASVSKMRLLPICYLLLVGGVYSVKGRSRRGQKAKRMPLHRSLNDMAGNEGTPITTEAEAESFGTSRTNDAGEGRLFRHLLLFKSLTNSNTNSNNGYVPYVIVNSPATLTNVNSNIIGNIPTTGTTTTGTTTGTAAGTGAGTRTGTSGGSHLKYGNNQRPLPYAIPGVPTPIYHQRNQPMPLVVYGPPLMNANRKKKNNVRNNPFSAIANNFKRLQFL